MKLFGQVIRTFVNVITLPVAIAEDVLTLGGTLTDHDTSYTIEKLQEIKEEADED